MYLLANTAQMKNMNPNPPSSSGGRIMIKMPMIPIVTAAINALSYLFNVFYPSLHFLIMRLFLSFPCICEID